MFPKLLSLTKFSFRSILSLVNVVLRLFRSVKVMFSKLCKKGGITMHDNPKMMTIREIAKTGLLSEHALRLLLKEGKLPAIYIGNKALVNYDKLRTELQNLDTGLTINTQTTD